MSEAMSKQTSGALIELCAAAYPLAKERLPKLRLLLVCGPRLAAEGLRLPPGVEVRGYVPRLYEHFAASDLAIVQGGGTTTLELTALRRPFLYFPLGQHFEQQHHVAPRLARHGAGIRLDFSRTTPAALANLIVEHAGSKATWPPIDTSGARRAAALIGELGRYVTGR